MYPVSPNDTPYSKEGGRRELEFRSRALSDGDGAGDGWKMEINNPLLFYVVTYQIRSMLLLLFRRKAFFRPLKGYDEGVHFSAGKVIRGNCMYEEALGVLLKK